MNAHTPGPWSFVKGVGKLLSRIYDSGGKLICIFGEPPSDANARLIAAAPELLEALYSIVDCCEEEHGVRDYASRQTEIRGIAKAAITKATGG